MPVSLASPLRTNLQWFAAFTGTSKETNIRLLSNHSLIFCATPSSFPLISRMEYGKNKNVRTNYEILHFVNNLCILSFHCYLFVFFSALEITGENLEDLLAYDDLFLDYFNCFLALPVSLRLFLT